MLGVEVMAANPTPERAVTMFIKVMEGATMVAAMQRVKTAMPTKNTVRWPMMWTRCCCTKKAYRQAGRRPRV